VKKKRTKGEKDQLEERMERFLGAPLALLASQGLSDGIGVALHVEGESYFFHRKKGRNTLSRVPEGDPDVHFWVSVNTMQHLMTLAELPGTGVATMGIAIFERILMGEESQRIRFRLDTGFLGLWSKGYFSVLKAGGPEVASYLARFGFDSLARVKEALQKARGK